MLSRVFNAAQQTITLFYTKKLLIMKKFFFLLLMLVIKQVYGQNDTTLFYLDANMKYTSKENAVVVGKKGQSGTNVRVNYFLIRTNQLLATIEYADISYTKRNGIQSEYYPDGKISKQMHFKNDIPDGLIVKWDQQGRTTDSINMQNGITISKIVRKYHEKELITRSFEDSLNDKYEEMWQQPNGNLSIVSFTGNKGLKRNFLYDGRLLSQDSVFSRDRKDARFPGDSNAWRNFLERHLNADIPISRKIPVGTYTVVIQFIVNEDGSLDAIRGLTKLGYGLEEEAVRVLKKSPRWEPALEFGRPVKGFIKQPVTFFIEYK
jgi:antitoxin component YwqK of YwqJK toxin-antitoxin module